MKGLAHWAQALVLLSGAKALHYVLQKSELLAADSTTGLIRLGFRWLIQKEKPMLSKSLYQGPAGSVSIQENGGIVSLTGSLSVGAGGGAAKGFASASASVSISLHEAQLADIGLEIAAKKFPSLAVEIGLVKAALDAELAKL